MDKTQSCDSVWDSLSAYADGLASTAERTCVEQHVATCHSCARDLAFMRQTANVLSDVPEIAPPAGLRDAILAATINKRAWYHQLSWSGARHAFRFPQIAYVGAAAASGVILAFVVVNRERSNSTDTFATASRQFSSLSQPHLSAKDRSAPPDQHSIDRNRNESVAVLPQPAYVPDRKIETAPMRSRMQPVDAGYHLPAPSPVLKPGGPSPRKPVANKPTSTADPGNRKSLKEPAGPTENVGPTMETANLMTPVTMDAEMAPMVKEGSAPSTNPNPATSAPAEAAHREYHIQLTTSDENVNAGAIASLADLRKSLMKNQTFKAPTIPLVRSNDRKEVKLDLVKGKF